MKSMKPRDSVAEMVRDLSEGQAFAKEFEEGLARRTLIKSLIVLRTRLSLSQTELATRLGCSQSKVSKLEASADADVRFGDLVDYAEAVGCEMRLLLVPKGQRVVDEVKMHAFLIQRLLHQMVGLAGGDGPLTEAVAGFLDEAALNLVRIVEKAAAKLPTPPPRPPRPFQVESVDDEEPYPDKVARR